VASEVLELIGKLYKVEEEGRQAPAPERLAVLGELRRSESRPLMDEIHRWLLGQAALPKSSFGRALGYALELWPGLVLPAV
jgi:hypothetical protein